jgi:hypothetical protein
MRLHEMFLTEAQDYAGMFTKIRQICRQVAVRPIHNMDYLDNAIEFQIKEARQKLKKHDRIIWYLRYYRSVIAHQWFEHASPHERKFFQPFMLDKIGNPTDEFDNTIYILEHYLSLPVPAIRNFVFNRQPALTVFNYFQELEDEWKESSGELGFSDPDVRTLIDFKNGFKWVDTGRAYCPKEQQAMGHCGNSPRSHTKDRILSLRRFTTKNGQEIQTPALTFVYDAENHALTEMKGAGNSKPAAKYFPYIIALLKLPMIEDVVGGGYLPQNNFKLSDLSPKQRKEVVTANPSLMNYWDLYEHQGYADDAVVRKLFKEVGLSYVRQECVGTVSSDHRTLQIAFRAGLWTSVLKGEWITRPWLTALRSAGWPQHGDGVELANLKLRYHNLWLKHQEQLQPIVDKLCETSAVKAEIKFNDMIERFDDVLLSYQIKFVNRENGLEAAFLVDLDAEAFIRETHDCEIHKKPHRLINNVIDLCMEAQSSTAFSNWFTLVERNCAAKLLDVFKKLDNAEKARPHL